MMKKSLKTLLILGLIVTLAGCSLPEVTPIPSATAESLPTSTAPVAPTAVPATPSPQVSYALITGDNASRMQAVSRAPAGNVQSLQWSLDSSSFSAVMQNTNGDQQVFTATVLKIPDLAPDGVFAAQAGTQIISVSPDGKTSAVVSADRYTINLVDIVSGSTLKTITLGVMVNTATFSPDGKWLVVSEMDNWKADLYDAATGELVKSLTGFTTAAPVYDVRFADSMKWLVWHARATIQMQDPAGEAMGARFSYEDFVDVFTLSPDGKFLASAVAKTINGNYIPTVQLGDAASGVEIATLELPAPAFALSFSPDGSLLAVGEGSEIQVWDVASARLLTTLADSNVIQRLAFSPDGKYLVNSAQNNQITLWAVAE